MVQYSEFQNWVFPIHFIYLITPGPLNGGYGEIMNLNSTIRAIFLVFAFSGMLISIFWEQSLDLLGAAFYRVAQAAAYHGHAHGALGGTCPIVGAKPQSHRSVDSFAKLIEDIGIAKEDSGSLREVVNPIISPMEIITSDELSFYDGTHLTRPSLVSIFGYVFDISSAVNSLDSNPWRKYIGQAVSNDILLSSQMGLSREMWIQAFQQRFPCVALLYDEHTLEPDSLQQSTHTSERNPCEAITLSQSDVDDLSRLRDGTIWAKLEDNRVLDLSEAAWLYGENGVRYALLPKWDAMEMYPCVGIVVNELVA